MSGQPLSLLGFYSFLELVASVRHFTQSTSFHPAQNAIWYVFDSILCKSTET
jgi:hypothetical protein